MKSDRRHELQTNELADWLGERMEAIKPHATAITIGIVAVVAVSLASVWYLTSEDTASARTWQAFFGAFNAREPDKELEKLVQRQPSAAAASWARQSVADMQLARGAELMFRERDEAQKLLAQAEAAYKEVEAAAIEPELRVRARLGLAKVYESLCKPEEAAKYYELVAESEKDTALGKQAADGARRMKDHRQVELLAWFAEQQPKRPVPFPGAGGGIPGLPSDLPDRPDLGIPGLDLDKLGTGLPDQPPPALPEPGAPPPDPAAPEGAPQEPKSESPPPEQKRDTSPEGTPPKGDSP